MALYELLYKVILIWYNALRRYSPSLASFVYYEKTVYVFTIYSFISSAQTSQEWMEAANLKMQEGNTLGAIKDYTSALASDRTLVDAYYGRGSVFAELLHTIRQLLILIKRLNWIQVLR